MKTFISILLLLLFHPLTVFCQRKDPVIDVHLHTYPLWSSNTWKDTAWYPKDFSRPSSSEELIRQTLSELDKYNVVKAVACASPERIQKWKESTQDRLVPGYEGYGNFKPSSELLEQLRQRIKAGEVKVLAEMGSQYAGISPSDTALEPFYKLAEEYDIPVGIHMGLAPSGLAYDSKYRSRLSNPLLLEEALTRHPKMRIYVMHAGWPMLDDMVAMLYAFPNLYVDIAVINWYIPKAEFYTYLKRLVEAGFSKRIMYGSDHMQWPQAISISIKAIETAPFLTKEQKRDIFYNNAVEFFRLNDKF